MSRVVGYQAERRSSPLYNQAFVFPHNGSSHAAVHFIDASPRHSKHINSSTQLPEDRARMGRSTGVDGAVSLANTTSSRPVVVAKQSLSHYVPPEVQSRSRGYGTSLSGSRLLFHCPPKNEGPEDLQRDFVSIWTL